MSPLQGISGHSHDYGEETDNGGGGDGGNDDVGKGSVDNGHLLRAPIRLPENVVVDVVIVTKREGVSVIFQKSFCKRVTKREGAE